MYSLGAGAFFRVPWWRQQRHQLRCCIPDMELLHLGQYDRLERTVINHESHTSLTANTTKQQHKVSVGCKDTKSSRYLLPCDVRICDSNYVQCAYFGMNCTLLLIPCHCHYNCHKGLSRNDVTLALLNKADTPSPRSLFVTFWLTPPSP